MKLFSLIAIIAISLAIGIWRLCLPTVDLEPSLVPRDIAHMWLGLLIGVAMCSAPLRKISLWSFGALSLFEAGLFAFFKWLPHVTALIIFCLICQPAFAADASIPYGAYITDFLAWSRDAAVLFIVYLLKSYGPPAIRQYITTLMVGKAVDYAIAVVGGAIKGKVWTIDITNEVLAEAEAFLQDHYGVIATWLGNRLRPLIIGQLSAIGAVPAEATKQTLL